MYRIVLVNLPSLVVDGIKNHITTDEIVVEECTTSISSEKNRTDLFMFPFRHMLTTVPHILDRTPQVPYCVWQDNPQTSHMKIAYLNGAVGCLAYDITKQDLGRAVNFFRQKKMFFGQSMTLEVADYYFNQKNEKKRSWGLSAREIQILKLLTRGFPNKQIALRLKISHQTVKNHTTSIYKKMSLDDRTQAVSVAFATGLIVPDSKWLDMWGEDDFGVDMVSAFREFMPLVQNEGITIPPTLQ